MEKRSQKGKRPTLFVLLAPFRPRNKMSWPCAHGRHKLSFLNYRRFVNFCAEVVASPGQPRDRAMTRN